MRITGNPGLDDYVNVKKHRKRVLFVSQPLSELYNTEDTGYNEFIAFENILKACDELGISPYIKFHPKETNKMIQLYKDYSVEGDIEDIAFHYDAIIGMTTMGLLQCSLMGIPVISFQPNLNTDDQCIINKLEIAQGTFSYETLVERLKIITGSVNESNLPFWYDGMSTSRCINELVSIK